MPDPEAPLLVALDPSAPSEEAERLALVLARALGSAVIFATVFPEIRLRSYVHSRHYEQVLRDEAERFLAERADPPSCPRAWCWRRRCRPAFPPRCSPPPAPR